MMLKSLYDGWCPSCMEKKEFEGTITTTESGRGLAVGNCDICGANLSRVLTTND